MPLAPEPGRFCWQRSFQGADGLPGWSRGGPRSIGVPMSVHDRAPRLRDGRRAAKPGAAGFAVWVEGTGIALSGGAAPAVRAWRGACVHRSAQARVSRQYHRMSSHALPPSGIIWSWGRGMPHSQHETAVARRAAGPLEEEPPVASAMTASPPHREPLSVRVGVGQPQEPAPTAAAPAVLACLLQLPRPICPDGPSPGGRLVFVWWGW